MKYFLFAALASSMLLISGCQKKDDTAPDPSKVTIRISNPVDGQTFHKGDTLFFKVDVNYVSELHGYDLTLSDTASQNTVFETMDHVHGDQFTVDTYWVDTLSRPAGLMLKMTAEIDHDGHEASKYLHLKSIP